jgi:hypothetical protein
VYSSDGNSVDVEGGGGAAWSQVEPHALFGDSMVLQQGQAAPVWKTADAGETVTVSFGDQTKKAVADGEGKWMGKLDALEANAEGVKLRIDDLVISDVFVGEVWVCSGQSNMAKGGEEHDGWRGGASGSVGVSNLEIVQGAD